MKSKQTLKIYHSMVSPIIKELKRSCESVEGKKGGREKGKGHEMVDK